MADRSTKQILSTSKPKRTGKTVNLVMNAEMPSKAGLKMKGRNK